MKTQGYKDYLRGLLDYKDYLQIRQQKPVSTTPSPPSDDRERDEIHEATQLRLALYKTVKLFEEQENVAIVEEKLLEEDIEKLVDGDEESTANEFTDTVLLDGGDGESHKENLKNIDDDDDVEKKDDKKDDDDDQDDYALIRN
nr:hypothetical protein [Tanacetum cinerariifolium]